MKTYYIKQKISFRDKYYVYDLNKQPCLEVKSTNILLTDIDRLFGTIFSLGNKIHIQHLDGTKAITIKKEISFFNQKYNLYDDENKIVSLKVHSLSFKPKISIIAQSGSYSIKGNLMARKFTIYKDNITLAEIKKTFFHLTDGYNIDIFDDNEEFICLAFLIILDNSYHN